VSSNIFYRFAGDNYLFIEFDKEISEEINKQVANVLLTLEKQPISGIHEFIPTFCSLCISYDPLRVSPDELKEKIDTLLQQQGTQQLQPPKTVEILTIYGGEYGPDLKDIAEYHGLSPEEVITIHKEGDYWVGLVGFLAGYPYLGGLSPKIATPRRKTPRTSVPRGSVAMAGTQTGIYPIQSPGGWHLIGRAAVNLFDVNKSPPALLSVGDRIKFVEIDDDTFKQLWSELELQEENRLSKALKRQQENMGTPVFKIIRPGLFTTIQDLGRPYYQKYGVTVSGAMDRYALRLVNLLVGNTEDQACIEVTMMGPTLEVLRETLLAITGGNLSPLLNNEPVPMWQTFLASPGDILSFGGWRSGVRGYISVAGGIQVPKVLGSRSTHVPSRLGGLDGRALQNGDVLGAEFYSHHVEPLEGMCIPPEWIPSYESKAIIRVLLGPQEDYYTSKGVETFLSSQYSVTDKSDRMGYRLTGPMIDNVSGTDIISESIPFGSIQVPSDGQPIIMLADRQTTGGYSKIATVAEVDVDVLAQMPLRTNLSFQAISLEAAHRLFREREQMIAQLSQTLKSEQLLRQLTL